MSAPGDDESQPCPPDAEFLELADEPSHKIVLENELVRAYFTELPPGHTTLLHRHARDTYTVFLCDAKMREQRPGELWRPPTEVAACAGYCRMYQENPIVHRIQAMQDNPGPTPILAVEVRPVMKLQRTSSSSLEERGNELEGINGYSTLSESAWDQLQPHKLTLQPGESTGIHSFSFRGVAIALKDGTLKVDVEKGNVPFKGGKVPRGHICWIAPPVRQSITNASETAVFEAIILELL